MLMPFEMFKKKALELIDSYQDPRNDILPSCDTLIEDLSDFFIVSRMSVKYRLIEVGLLGLTVGIMLRLLLMRHTSYYARTPPFRKE